MYWKSRDELSLENRLRRSYYELLRDDLDQFLTDRALRDSYRRFKERGIPYPYVERKELKPRARIPKQEYELQNTFLLIFAEETIPPEHKKYIRFFDDNRTTKVNLTKLKSLPLGGDFDRTLKFLDGIHFFDFLESLLPVDYALLIQKDPASGKGKHRYALSHFHVRIDWPITDAAEDLARYLRYISKDLYEKGEKCAEAIQKKFFEYYGLPDMIGGRRTAASVAAQYFRRFPFITTIYVSSSESRSLIRYSENGIFKTVLLPLKNEEYKEIAAKAGLTSRRFSKCYILDKNNDSAVFIFRVIYSHTPPALPPDDGKMRDIKPELFWLTVKYEHILPLPGIRDADPIRVNLLYTT